MYGIECKEHGEGVTVSFQIFPWRQSGDCELTIPDLFPPHQSNVDHTSTRHTGKRDELAEQSLCGGLQSSKTGHKRRQADSDGARGDSRGDVGYATARMQKDGATRNGKVRG